MHWNVMKRWGAMKQGETQCSAKKFENNMVIKTTVPFRREEIRCNAMKRSETPWGAMNQNHGSDSIVSAQQTLNGQEQKAYWD